MEQPEQESDEAAILAKYSSPGLKHNMLTRREKDAQLQDIYKKMSKEDREKILDELYGPK